MFERLKQILSKVDARIFPLLTAVVSLVILIVAKKPWQTTLAEWAEKGKRAPLAEYVTAGFWQGCVAALVISLLVVCTARWWMRGPGATGRVSLPPEAPLGRRKFMLVLAAGLLVIGLHRWQRQRVVGT